MGVKGYCRTNLDGYSGEDWPTEFVAVPRIGEHVEGKRGRVLKVVGITHKMVSLGPGYCGTVPEIEVELNR